MNRIAQILIIFMCMECVACGSDTLSQRKGKSIPGVFVDHEGDYGYKLAWSDHLAKRYQEKYQSDIRLFMPLMFDRDIEDKYSMIRWRWFEVVSDIYSEYLGGVSRWLEERNMYCISNQAQTNSTSASATSSTTATASQTNQASSAR